MQNKAIEQAKINYQKIACCCHFAPPSPVSFEKIKPEKSATIRILQYIKLHPNCGRSEIKNYYKLQFGRCLSQTTFQNILWAELITSRKYNLTKLGRRFLAAYIAE